MGTENFVQRQARLKEILDIISCLDAPASNLVRTISGPGDQIVEIISAVEDLDWLTSDLNTAHCVTEGTW